jgi:cyclopropane fatty-acyl-phospholipid synthase-like methyltransferase
MVGGVRARRLFVKNDVRIQPNQKILDIGCGPGYIIDFLPNVDYVGIDLDSNYIKTAKESYKQAHFFCSSIEDFEIKKPNSFDIVMATGVIHHLNDQQTENLFKLAKTALKSNGRLVTMDGCFIKKQNRIAKAFLKSDRGQYIREEEQYLNLASKHFKNVKSKIDESYFHIPYTSIILECS